MLCNQDIYNWYGIGEEEQFILPERVSEGPITGAHAWLDTEEGCWQSIFESPEVWELTGCQELYTVKCV